MAHLHFRFFFSRNFILLQYHLLGVNFRNLAVSVYTTSFLSGLCWWWWWLFLFVLLENQNIREFSHRDGRNVSSQLFVPSEGGSCNSQLSPLPILPPSSGSGRIPPSRICNQQYRNAPNDTNTDKVRFLFPWATQSSWSSYIHWHSRVQKLEPLHTAQQGSGASPEGIT